MIRLARQHTRAKPSATVVKKVFEILEDFKELEKKIGHSPNVTELLRLNPKLYTNIINWFQGISTFRKLIGISQAVRVRRKTRTDAEITALQQMRNLGGYTLEELRVFAGNVTRERVRQLLETAGENQSGKRAGWSEADPLKIMKILREDCTITNIDTLSKKSGNTRRQILEVLDAFHLTEAVKRLFQFRKLPALKVLREEMLEDLRMLAKKLGRTPRQRDIDNKASLFSVTSYYNHFGSLRTAQELAELAPTRQGNRIKKKTKSPLNEV